MQKLSNSVRLIGYLGMDPELKETSKGNKLCHFSLATHEYYKDKEGERQDRTEWHKVVVWGKRAEPISDLLEKGMKIAVEGQLRHRKVETPEGGTKLYTDVILNEFEILARPKQEDLF